MKAFSKFSRDIKSEQGSYHPLKKVLRIWEACFARHIDSGRVEVGGGARDLGAKGF